MLEELDFICDNLAEDAIAGGGKQVTVVVVSGASALGDKIFKLKQKGFRVVVVALDSQVDQTDQATSNQTPTPYGKVLAGMDGVFRWKKDVLKNCEVRKRRKKKTKKRARGKASEEGNLKQVAVEEKGGAEEQKEGGEEREEPPIMGVCKRWDNKRGFGFIRPEGWAKGKDVFVHNTAIVATGRRFLKKGMLVMFRLGTHEGKQVAKQVVRCQK